jgi:hypothetical protein
MRRHNLNKQAWATPSRGSLRRIIRKGCHVPEDGQLAGKGYGNERRPHGIDYQVPSGRNRVGALMNMLLSMCLGFIVLTLALLVFWVLSQFDPLR